MYVLNNQALLRTQCYLDGRWVDADDSSSINVHDPATHEVIATVPKMANSETERAIQAASRAFPIWRDQTAESRSIMLRRWHDLVLQNKEDLARIMTFEQGKPLAEARSEIAYAASYILWFAEEARRIYGDIVPSPWADKQILVSREPLGVCAAITPWNFPAAMITRKVAPALAAGCTIIVKPASQTPFSALALVALADMAGIPAGVFNVLTGDSRSIGGVLTSDDRVRKLSFTGSTEVGRVLAAQCAPTLKRMSLELGGNAPFIVFDDADLDAAVEGAMISKFRNSGQTCVCTNRFLIQDDIYDAFAEKLRKAVELLEVGNGIHEGVDQGPIIDDASLQKIKELVAEAVSSGASIVAGGHSHPLGGTFYRPTILGEVTTSMRIAKEEIFGPVATLFRFKDESEAIAMANDTEFGLAAYFYSSALQRVWRVASKLEYGMVGINTGVISTAVAPFGGVKQSGIGREGSKFGIEEYMDTKYLCVGGL